MIHSPLDRLLVALLRREVLAHPSGEPDFCPALCHMTRQEEKVLTLWMDGASNQKIAAHLSINGKTVYTYKRNIRMKLHMDTRFSPFLSLQESES